MCSQRRAWLVASSDECGESWSELQVDSTVRVAFNAHLGASATRGRYALGFSACEQEYGAAAVKKALRHRRAKGRDGLKIGCHEHLRTFEEYKPWGCHFANVQTKV